MRFNPAKLLIDPYAKAVAGRIDWDKPIFPYRFGGENSDLVIDRRDSASGMPKGIVTSPYFDWEHDRPPRIPLSDSIIYEVHVRGFSMLNEQIQPELRGTYAGLASPAALEYLKPSRRDVGRVDAGSPVCSRQSASSIAALAITGATTR